MDDPQRTGRHVGRHELRLDEGGELAAHRALEIAPDLERHWSVCLAERSGVRERRRGIALRAQEVRTVGVRARARALHEYGCAEDDDAEPADHESHPQE